MKAYYELSYVDVFGHGNYEYFYCTEEQIKVKAKALFDKEIVNVATEEQLKECGMSKKTFEFDNDKCKGYIVKEAGFVLPHHINWKKLPFDPLNKNIKNVYVLQSQCHYMTISYLDVYSNLQEAKKQMKAHLKEPSEIAKENEDGTKLPNGIVKKTEHGYICGYFYWEKTSYEYDEWDITSISNTLTVKKIKKVA